MGLVQTIKKKERTFTDVKTKRIAFKITPSTNVQLSDADITYFDFDLIVSKFKKGSAIKLGSLQMTSNKIGIGELVYNILPCKKGKWNIFQYNSCLIAVLDGVPLKSQRFIYTGKNAGCDIGMFAFMDGKIVQKLPQRTSKRGKSNTKSKKPLKWLLFPGFGTSNLNPNSRNKNKIGKHDAYYIYTDNIGPQYEHIPFALFAHNGFGDGGFPIYKGKDAYLILSGNMGNQIFDLANQFPRP